MYGAREEGGYLQIAILTYKFQIEISQIFIQINPQIHIFNTK